MAPKETSNVALSVFYNSAEPVALLLLHPEDKHLAWLKNHMDVAANGNQYSLYLHTPKELKQVKRLFPLMALPNRHLRFTGVLQKTAIKRVSPPIDAQLTPGYSSLATPAAVSKPVFRWTWLKSFLQFSLNCF